MGININFINKLFLSKIKWENIVYKLKKAVYGKVQSAQTTC
jgi:hypothetical protein